METIPMTDRNKEYFLTIIRTYFPDLRDEHKLRVCAESLKQILCNRNYPLWVHFQQLPMTKEPKLNQQYFCLNLTESIGRVKLLNIEDSEENTKYTVLQTETETKRIISISKGILPIEDRMIGLVEISHIPEGFYFIFTNSRYKPEC